MILLDNLSETHGYRQNQVARTTTASWLCNVNVIDKNFGKDAMVKEGERFVTSKTALSSLKESHLTSYQGSKIIVHKGKYSVCYRL